MPAGNDDVVIPNPGPLIRIDRAALADPEALSVTRMVNVDEPAVVGVPEMVPRERLNPAGSEPIATAHV